MKTSDFNIPDFLSTSNRQPELIYESDSGYCRVFSALSHGRRIALKVLKADYISSEIHRNLLRKEYEIGHALYHPNIISILGLEEVGVLGLAIIMEFVDGITLEEYLKTNGAMAQNEAMVLIEQICGALAYLHSRQLIHRDLKPSNIMITCPGHYVKLIDFGMSDGTSFTDFKYPGGTPYYSAPEQLAEGVDNDPRADIFSLGVIMREICPGSKGSYRKIADRCMAHNPSNRPADASKIPQSVIRSKVKRRWTAITAVFIFLILLSGTCGWLLIRSSDDHRAAVLANSLTLVDSLSEIGCENELLNPENDRIDNLSPSVKVSLPAYAEGEYQLDENLDSMIYYARNFVNFELEKWYSSDSAAFSFEAYRIFDHLDNYVESNCNGGQTYIRQIKSLLRETAASEMRGFYRNRNESGQPDINSSN